MNEQRILEAVQYPIGLTADPAQDNGYLRQAYLELIAPGETPERQAEMARMSGCALVVAGMWRHLGIKHPLLEAPYVDQTAVLGLWEIARAAKALRRDRTLADLRIGDVVRVMEPEHVFTVLNIEWTEAMHCVGVDGGQREDGIGYQCVEKVDRRLLLGIEFREGKLPRFVQDWIDVRAVIAAFGSCK